jgi:hypothetical protein
MTLKANAPIKALQKPQRNLNPCTKKAASPKIIPLITNENNPKVRKVIGIAIKAKIGCKIAFRIPKTIAEINPFCILSISTPVGSLEIMNKAIVVTSKEMIIERIFI